MKTKTILLASLLFATSFGIAQITPSLTIPDPIPNYNGTYDDFGTNHLFYPNDGEIRFANTDQTNAKDVVKFYTMNTYPKKFLMRDNNLSYLHYKAKSPGSGGADSLQRIDISWFNSSTSAFLARVDTQNFSKLNYFTQWFGAGGRTSVMGGAAIACQSIYPNIDLVYTSNNSGLVMYFIVYPGGNYKNIIMNISGAKATSIVSNKLKIDANWESSSFEKPEMYQYTYVSNVVTPVNIANANWSNIGTNKYQLNTSSSFSSTLPLIIQIKQANATTIDTPGLNWSTYFGGTGQDLLNKTHVDANDNLYTAGYSQSSNISFPQGPGAILNPNSNGDGAIAKFDNGGILQWTTFIGGSSWDEIHDFDFNGNSIYFVGKTASSSWTMVTKAGATNNNAFAGGTWDAFIGELFINPVTQAIQNNWLTYYGGNGNEELNACKFDASGNFYVVGSGASTNMTVTGSAGTYTQNFNSAQLVTSPLSTDGIIAKFNNSSLQTWFTFYGTDALGANAYSYPADYLYDLAISGTDLYVCGKSGGTNLPNGLNSKSNASNFDGILVHFLTSGALMTNSAKYTNGNASNYAVETHGGEVYTVGQAYGSMTTVNSGQHYFDSSLSGTSDACFSVHDEWIGTTLHNTYLGGIYDEAAYDILFTNNNLMLIAGGTNSSNFPTNNLNPMYFSTGTPNGFYWANDNFVSCFQKGDTNIIWSSYLGSEVQESSLYPSNTNSAYEMRNTAIAVDSQNALYLLGWSSSYNTFPLDQWTGSPVYFQAQTNSWDDATITRFEVGALNEIVGIKDFENTEFVFGFYPNPTTRTISITNKELSSHDLQYAIYDLSGKKIKAGNFNADWVKEIDVSSLPEGVYIINVSNGRKTYSNKFVKAGN